MTTQPPADAPVRDLTNRVFRGTDADSISHLSTSDIGRIRLRFSASPTAGTIRVSATAGGNRMNATAEWVGRTLKADRMMSTLMMGPEPIMALERWLSDLLTSGPTVTETDGGIVLSSEVGRLTLVEVPPTPLRGTNWTLTGILTTDAISSVLAGVEAGLRIEPAPANGHSPDGDPTVSGQAQLRLGCNSGASSVTITSIASDSSTSSGTIQFGPVGSTRMMCGEAAMAVEAHLLGVCSGVVSYEIDEDALTIKNAAGQGARFTVALT